MGQTLKALLIKNALNLKYPLLLYSSIAIQVIKKLDKTKKYSKPKNPNLPYVLIDSNKESFKTLGLVLTKPCAAKTKKNAIARVASKF
jgi:hypothetical protein